MPDSIWTRTPPGPRTITVPVMPVASAADPCTCHSCRRSRGELAGCDCDRCAIRHGETVTHVCSQCDDEFEFGSRSDYGDFCSPDCYVQYWGGPEDDDDDDGFGSFNRTRVHNYSYCPPLNFLRANEDEDEKLFFGFELEVPTETEEAFAEEIFDQYGKEEQLLYCKEDGSIDGVEIVSHPMTHKYFRETFPFEMFDRRRKLSKMLSRYGSDDTPREYGLHVHVSRAGFKNEAHILRWLLLIYRNQDAVSALARRDSDQWAHFMDNDRCYDKARNVTRSRGNYVRDPETGRRVYDEEAINEYAGYEGDRYVAVNAQNADTFELRVFRSTWEEQELRAAVDFAHATVAYSRGLAGTDVTRGNALSFDRFRAWVADRPQYEALTRELNKVLPQSNALFGANIELTESEVELACAS